MGFLLVPIFIVYLLLALICITIVIKFKRSNILVLVVILFFVLFPFRRLIFYQILFSYYSYSPLKEIHEIVDYPISVYWEDNVWPGFDLYGRQWMVKNYLDGKHLKLLALNGDDGKIYLYRADDITFSESNKLQPEYMRVKEAIEAEKKEAATVGISGGDNKAMWKKIREGEDVFIRGLSKQYQDQNEMEIAGVLDRVKVYADKTDLPQMHYRVEFNHLPKSFLLNNQNKIIHADQISIVDTESEKEIAFSIRYMAYSWTRYFGDSTAFDYKLGDIQPYKLDDKVLFGYAGVRDNIESMKGRLERSDYNRRFNSKLKNINKSKGMSDAR